MANINLRDYYPEIELNCYVNVTDGEEKEFIAALTREIVDIYIEFHRAENAYCERRRVNKAYYSLNTGDGIENDAVNRAPSPEDILVNRITDEQLYDALAALKPKQRRRIELHFIYGMSITKIAKLECAAKSSISESIELGLQNMKNILKKFQ